MGLLPIDLGILDSAFVTFRKGPTACSMLTEEDDGALLGFEPIE